MKVLFKYIVKVTVCATIERDPGKDFVSFVQRRIPIKRFNNIVAIVQLLPKSRISN